MELSGTLSNPSQPLETSLERVATVARQLIGREPSSRSGRIVGPRGVSVQAMVEEIVRSAGRPIRVKDVCAALEEGGIDPFDKASIRKTLNDGSRARQPRYHRVGWGLYEPIRTRELISRDVARASSSHQDEATDQYEDQQEQEADQVEDEAEVADDAAEAEGL